MEFTGKITLIGETEQKSETFSIRQLVVTNDARKYPEIGVFTFKNKACDKLNGFKVGQEVNVKFDMGGREYNGKYYCDLNGWDINNFMGESKSIPNEPEPFTTDNLPI